MRIILRDKWKHCDEKRKAQANCAVYDSFTIHFRDALKKNRAFKI